ncbi:MAG: hypothetical protein P8M04_02160 [Akkermansiaceae bacterium]|nr:hypothetical protein [Akkermansiaceae bacterium]
MKLIFSLVLALSLTSHSQLRIESKGFNMNDSDLRSIFKSTLIALPKAKTFKDPSLFVSKHERGPITLFQRTPRGEIAIQLNSGDYYYSQCIYQFAHELAHVRADFQPIEHENKWLEETLCETASLFVLRKLSKEWEENAPNNALKNYRKHLATYAATVMKSRETLTTETSPAFYRKHQETLRKSATEREINGAYANLLLPLFEKEPEHWKVLPKFPRIKGSTLAKHFAAWRKATSKNHHDFLNQFEALFLKK